LAHTVRFWKAQKKIRHAASRSLPIIVINPGKTKLCLSSGEIWPVVIEKQAIPGLNREIIANALLQVAWLNPLKSQHFDPDALWNRVHGDVTLLRELVDLFAAEVPVMLAGIEKAIKNGLPSDLERASHKIKGSMLQFSAHAAADIALQLEQNGRIGSMAGTESLLQKLRQEISELQQTLRAMVRDGV
jgi:histidine phosphotransfer protein HptB